MSSVLEVGLVSLTTKIGGKEGPELAAQMKKVHQDDSEPLPTEIDDAQQSEVKLRPGMTASDSGPTPIEDIKASAGPIPSESEPKSTHNASCDKEDQLHIPILEHSPYDWNELWKNKTVPWDRGGPSAALAEILEKRQDLVGKPVTSSGRRRRVLIPGCGNGYDVALFSIHGFDTYGLDASEEAIQSAKRKSENLFQAYKQVYGTVEKGSGKMSFIQGDYFKDDFAYEAQLYGLMDIIFDCQFFCMFPPESRPEVASRHARLLAKRPGSRLVCLESTLSKEPNRSDAKGNSGPPFGVSAETYTAHLGNPKAGIEYKADGYPEPKYLEPCVVYSPDRPLVRIEYIKPEESFCESDRVSIWHQIGMAQSDIELKELEEELIGIKKGLARDKAELDNCETVLYQPKNPLSRNGSSSKSEANSSGSNRHGLKEEVEQLKQIADSLTKKSEATSQKVALRQNAETLGKEVAEMKDMMSPMHQELMDLEQQLQAVKPGLSDLADMVRTISEA